MAGNVKKRIFYFDELRALAIVLVVLCHATVLYKPFTYETLKVSIPGILYILTHVAVPIFFMLSGALLLNRDYSLKEFYTKRFSRIVLPFLFWAFIAIIVMVGVFNKGSSEIFKILLGKNRWTWFVWVMIGIYLILPVVNSFVKEFKDTGVKYFLIIWFITILINTFHKNPFPKFELSYFAGYIGYLILGYYLAKTDFKLSDKKMMLIGFILFLVFTAINLYITIKHVKKIDTKYLSVFVVMASAGVFLMFRYFAHYCEGNPSSKLSRLHKRIENGKFGIMILSLSLCSYGMYLVNSLLYRFFKDVDSIKLLPVIFIIVLILSWLSVKIVNKIPHLSKFSGEA